MRGNHQLQNHRIAADEHGIVHAGSDDTSYSYIRLSFQGT
jgi:hypothetical protein